MDNVFCLYNLPADKLAGSNFAGMKGAPPAGSDVGESMMGPGKAEGLPNASVCWIIGICKTKRDETFSYIYQKTVEKNESPIARPTFIKEEYNFSLYTSQCNLNNT